MSSSTAELTLIIRAQNLAEAEMAKVRTSLSKVSTTAGVVARDVANAFRGIGKRIAGQFGNLATDILTGGKVEDNLIFIGATMAGAIVEGLAAHLIPTILTRVLATEAFAPIAAALSAGGLTLGSVFSTAIAVGMAAFPVVLLGVVLAALTYLAVNPEARHKVEDIAKDIVARIGQGLQTLGKMMYDRFVAGFNIVQAAVRSFIAEVIVNITSIPSHLGRFVDGLVYNFKLAFYRAYYAVKKIVGDIVDAVLAIPKAVAKALESLGHLGGTTFTIVAPGTRPQRHAEGGWVGLHGPELGILGERGPEYVVPNHRLGDMGRQSSGGFTIQGISERQIVDMVDRGLYFRLQRAAPTSGRV